MSKELELLEINKCILSKLWYTTLIFLKTNVRDNSFKERIATDCTELQLLLKRIISENDNQFKWILHTLLLQVINISSLNANHNPQIKLDHLSVINAIKLCNNVSLQAQQKLFLLFQTITNVPCKTSEFVKPLSEESLICLKKCLNEKPGLLCWVINKLCRYTNNFPQIHDALQDLYSTNLKDFVQEVTDQYLHKQCKESYTFKEKPKINEKQLGITLCILSRMQLMESKENEILTMLFPVLLRIQNRRDIELAFYCREDIKLFNKWFSFVDKAYARSEPINTLDTALCVANAMFDFQQNSIAFLQANELMQRIRRTKSHWLNGVLDILYMFTIQNKSEEVTLVLSCQLISNIYPVLLFKVLNDYLQKEMNSTETWRDILERNITICNSLRFILHKCNFVVWNDFVLSRLDVTLKNHIKVVEHILNWKKMYITDESSNNNMQLSVSEQSVSTKYILHLLQNFSVLKVLKMTSNIYEKNFSEIQNILREVAESENIFQAYYSMLCAVKAIALCEFYNTNYKYVIKHFSDMKFYLQSLFPLTLRLETIENIFSLLFMHQEDFNVISNDVEDSINASNENSKSERRLTEQSRTGFICNKYAVRDMLHHLKNSILATGIDYTKQKRDMGCTEELDKIHKRISAITKALTDATWRLELYTSSSFIENIGINENECQSSHTVKESSVFFTEKTKLLHQLKHKNTSLFYQEEDNSLEDTKVKSDSGSESGLICNNTRWRKRLKTIMLTADNSVAKDIGDRPFFINFMLASKKSLILQSLWRSDYIKAQEVIEMFNMKNTQLDGEIRFSKALQLFRQDVSKYSSISNIDFTKRNIKSSTLENIRLVAQEGIQSSKHTNQLETFLASQETNLRLINTDNLNSNEILILSVLDLALTIGHTYQISNNLCDVAIKYLKLHKTFDNSEHAHFFMKVYQLLYENKNEISMIDILCDAKILLSLKDWKEKNERWKDLKNKYHEFKESQKHNIITDTKLKNNNYFSEFKILKKIITICNNNAKYLQYVYSHLQQLTAIIPTSTADTTVITISDLLEISLHFYFGHQIYDLNIAPDKLERIAKKLQVNLIYSILINICPRLLYDNNENEKSDIHQKTTGCIILNKTLGDSNLNDWKIKNPNQCVLEILTEFLQILHDLTTENHCINYTNYNVISKYPQVQVALNKTSCLANIDLSELSIGDETLTFFLNTWNLMFLHTSLIIWGNNPPFNKLQHKISLMSVGYIIGDLGLVTLSALRSKLLGTLTPDFKLFLQFEELNEPAWQDLDLAQDPRIIFAMAHEFYGTPRMRIFEAKKLNENLNQATRDYIDHYLQHSIEDIDNLQSQKILVLPELVQQYQQFFIRNLKSPATKNYENLFSVNEYLKLDENMTIRYVSPYYLYEIFLRYSIHAKPTLENKNEIQSSVWQIHTIRPSLLQYLEGHCWLLSYLVQRMRNENPTILENSCDNLKRTACLENLLNSVWVEKLKPLFDNNQILTTIHETISIQKLWSYFETLLQNGDWFDCLEIINALPDSTMSKNIEVQVLKDKILSQLVSIKESISNANILQYLYQINDIHILTQTILHNISKWHVNVCEYALLHALHHVDNNKLPINCKQRMQEILCRITIFHKMLPYCANTCNSTWFDVMYCTEKVNSNQIIKSLINADKFELCLEWLECQEFSLDIQSSFTQDFLIGLLKNETHNFQQALKLLQALPLGPSIKMCKSVLKNLESINALQFVTNYLLEHCKTADTMKYTKTLIGIDILKMLEAKERPLYIHLIKEPLLMLEQLLMNCKFESIQKILNEISNKLHQTDISISKFDRTIRFYAMKSLDFRVSLQRDGIENKLKNCQLSTLEASTNEFVMPITIPTKEEWVPNDKARECSCCKAVIFSMFNRRHHCRRCGRVVCAVCSQHRMQVSGYPTSMLVRVCDDCKQQTVLQMRAVQGVPSTPSSETFDYWRLTRDETHNQTIREEFSFEYAPNNSLCLAILNLHSDHKAYTSFLLDRCDEMKRLLQPVSGKVNPEIDHAVIIKMIRSLLVAAKVKCAKLGLNTGLAHCDRFLSQVDLISTLVQSDCLALIPTDDLDEHTLRKLRDLLTEKEQWTLALDVSTKAGLDTQGVWATWGKACLKIGYFEQARDKFYHCLDKILHEYHDDWVVVSYPKESISKIREHLVEGNEKDGKNNEFIHRKKCEHSKLRPVKDPPLLTEILQILDTLNTHKHRMQYSYHCRSDSALEMSNTLSGLKAFNLGQLATKQPNMEDIYYQESLYYLLTYGSYNSILKFFLKHEEFDKCLTYVLDNNLEPDLYFNGVYLYCLKNGIVDKLHNAMKAKDSNLLSWRKYLIYVCHCLEKKQYLNILYELQLFMKDCIRAAMTCILFYTNGANSYTDLCSRGQLLLDAQKHLESQIENFNRGRRKSTSSFHCNQNVFTMEMEPSEIDRHINTISRQMEITKFLRNSENEGRAPVKFLNLFPDIDYNTSSTFELPTLFGNQQQKIHLAVLAILCGCNVEEGFGIAFRIMQDYNLPQQKIYSLAGHVLALNNNIGAIEQFTKCCRSSGTPNSNVISDYVLTHCVKLFLNRTYNEPELKINVNSLIRMIIDIELKISAYIESKQLKAAYLLAVKHSRVQDIRKILKESEKLGQNAIKAICLKWLQQYQQVKQ